MIACLAQRVFAMDPRKDAYRGLNPAHPWSPDTNPVTLSGFINILDMSKIIPTRLLHICRD